MLGFACKYMDLSNNKEIISKMNLKSTTLTYLNKQKDPSIKLLSIVKHNLKAIKHQINYVNSLPKELHMLRLGSQIFPFFSHTDYSWFYKQTHIKDLIETTLQEISKSINNIRVTFHPGQFVVLASDKDNVIKRAINEIEDHTYIAKHLNLTNRNKTKINIHLSGALGIKKFRESFELLSPLTKTLLTVENVEYKYGLDEVLQLGDLLPIVFDIHHDFVHNEKFIDINDGRIKDVIQTWRGIKPIMHYSQPVDYKFIKKRDLRKHSNYFTDDKINNYVLNNFYDKFDIMCESKCKNLASIDLYNRYLKK